MSVPIPLPERLRPKDIADFVGQTHLMGRLETLMKADHLPSLLFFGPPGCGKSTLALLLAKHAQKRTVRISAPEAGLANLRKALQGMDILVLDEIHRFSKAQQDFFLPLIECGDLILLATTTENPSFSVTRQLLSRMQIVTLRPLGLSELITLGKRGAKAMGVTIPEETLTLLAKTSSGDARTLLNFVDYMGHLEGDLDPSRVKNLLPELIIRHDKKGDSHYEYISALIKSIRGSDVDAALYYLACMLEGGEDPRSICRRLILSASEDVGLADPRALQIAVACQQAVEFVGMPEGFLPMAETVVYLSLAKKSNTAYVAYRRAQHVVKRDGPAPVPLHLRNPSTQLLKEWGYGQGYKYPHDFPEAWVPQQYLPPEVKERLFYQPKTNGEEPYLAQFWRKKYRS